MKGQSIQVIAQYIGGKTYLDHIRTKKELLTSFKNRQNAIKCSLMGRL